MGLPCRLTRNCLKQPAEHSRHADCPPLFDGREIHAEAAALLIDWVDRRQQAKGMRLECQTAPLHCPHIDGTVQAIAAVHAEHYQRQATLQRAIGSVVSTAARPAFVVILVIAVAGRRPPRPPVGDILACFRPSRAIYAR
jgi:hypothetical protein